jgi:D-serine dehydratase
METDRVHEDEAATTGRATPLDKGIGALSAAAGARPGWRLLAEELSLPAALLDAEALEHNLRWMQSFIDAYGLKLAPHGKTTMAPALFRRQIAGGAWGITVATAQQALVAASAGVPQILMANQLVGRRNMEVIAELLAPAEHPGFFCLVDSAAGVELVGSFFRGRGLTLDVLLELGPQGGRTGVRDGEQEQATLAALEAWRDSVRLAGVELFEGVLPEEAEVRGLLQRAVALLETLVRDGRVERRPPILSGAGSAWYDVVAEEFSRVRCDGPVDVVLRPGCYLTHDVGLYRGPQARILERNSIARRMQEGLRPALRLWAYVHSVPEGAKAVVGLGKRDAAFDAGYPTPALLFRPGRDERPLPAPAHWTVTGMMDQHAYLQIAPGDDLRPGDMLGFDISHPCLTFDKYRQIAVVDRDYRVVELLQTFF